MTHIWHKPYTLAEINSIFAKNMTGFLDIEAVEITDNSLSARMPITEKVKQPYGLLHGGASVVLAESLGSIASALVINLEKSSAVGMEINANHLRSATEGYAIASCSPIHLGATTHVWDIKIHHDNGKLLCISRLTVAIIRKK